MGIELTGSSKKEDKYLEIIQPAVEDQGYILYDMEYLPHQPLIRVFICQKDSCTATIEDCVAVDRAISFEEHSWIPENIVLEVSSPGLYRKLKTSKHFETAIGERVACNVNKSTFDKLSQNETKIKTNKFLGTLDRFDEEFIFLNDEKLGAIQVPLECIKKLNLEPNI